MPSKARCSRNSSLSFLFTRLKNELFDFSVRRYARARFSSMVMWGAVPRMGS